MTARVHDLVVIGGGPAGLAAAVYARRAGHGVLILERAVPGGQMNEAPRVENYPGISTVSGAELTEQMTAQAEALGAVVVADEALAIRQDKSGARTPCITVQGKSSAYPCRAVILATGSRHRPLGVENEDAFLGRGLSRCALCDGALYRGRNVAVIGGGNTALGDALLLAGLCHRVYVVQNLDRLTGEAHLAQRLAACGNVQIIYRTVVEALEGAETLTALCLRNTETGESVRLAVDGVFTAIGRLPDNERFGDAVTLDESGYFAVGEDCRAKLPGVFVAGDCRRKDIRQITTAVADGTVAATAASQYLKAMADALAEAPMGVSFYMN